MGFGYGYSHPGAPPPHSHPLFSPNHSYVHHPHQHTHSHPPGTGSAPTGPPPGRAASHHFGPIPGNHHHQGLTVTQGHGTPLGSLTHSFASALSPGMNATMLMGHPGAAGPYAGSHLAQTANHSGAGGLIGPGQPAAGGPGPNSSIPPGALTMTSVNYWPNTAPGLTHLPAADFPLSAGPSNVNGFPTVTEQASPDGFGNTQLASGSQPNGLCSVFMSPNSAASTISRVQEDAVNGGLLGNFVPCIGTKDPGMLITDGTMVGGLPGLYASTPPASSTSPSPNALKLAGGSLQTCTVNSNGQGTSAAVPPAPPSSSFAAKQGLKPRYFQRNNNHSSHNSQSHTGHHSTGGRGNRNTVVAVKVGSKDKNAAGMVKGTRQNPLKVVVPNGPRLDENNSHDNNNKLLNTDKKYTTCSNSTIKGQDEVKETESGWQDGNIGSSTEDGRVSDSI
ncbi:hypothetical protein FBUS_05996 [Fasciolopsis buskii]|uniref:Uncharacterized protein n=1 Tax=Fasciolopsis buskii TaxID=27845 RepID=A0A8E0RQA2_9TREM|nr:hypothetical protein FBUS_05996 [Fasciolopsis buski]